MTRYSPYTWADNEAGATPITAARLNALEAGVDVAVPVADISATGTASSSTYLRGDGTWATPTAGEPDASTTVKGIVELATSAETTTGTDTVRATTPAGVKAVADTLAPLSHTHGVSDLTATGSPSSTTYLRGDNTWATPPGGTPSDASDTVKGIVELATSAETLTGTDTVRATTPAGVKAVADTKAAASHTHAASDIASGTIATARLGSGSATSSTYLRGDQTYAALPASSDTASGIVELATTSEATTGTDTARAVTAAGVKAVMDAHVALSDPHTQYLKETDAANYRDSVFSQGGTLTTGTGVFRLYNRSGVTRTLRTVTASVGTQPTGASILIDVNISGTTIFTTQSNRPTIAVSTNEDESGAPDVTAWTNGSYLTIDIDQIGSTVAGANLVVTVVWS